jgi:hypothetical protein
MTKLESRALVQMLDMAEKATVTMVLIEAIIRARGGDAASPKEVLHWRALFNAYYNLLDRQEMVADIEMHRGDPDDNHSGGADVESIPRR